MRHEASTALSPRIDVSSTMGRLSPSTAMKYSMLRAETQSVRSAHWKPGTAVSKRTNNTSASARSTSAVARATARTHAARRTTTPMSTAPARGVKTMAESILPLLYRCVRYIISITTSPNETPTP